jgi:hypothetical protein
VTSTQQAKVEVPGLDTSLDVVPTLEQAIGTS